MPFDRFTLLVRRLAAVLFWPALVLVVWGELSAGGGVPELTLWDKLLHFTAYFGLAAIAAVALKADRRTLWVVLALSVVGGVLEVLQGLVGRDADLYDEVANTLGAIVGAGAGWLFIRLQAKLVGRARPS